MKAKYQLICMSFNGEYQKENPKFNTIDGAWEYGNDIGSKWFFYPFYFVVSGTRIISAPDFAKRLEGKYIKTAQKIFEYTSELPKCKDMGADSFALEIHKRLFNRLNNNLLSREGNDGKRT